MSEKKVYTFFQIFFILEEIWVFYFFLSFLVLEFKRLKNAHKKFILISLFYQF